MKIEKISILLIGFFLFGSSHAQTPPMSPGSIYQSATGRIRSPQEVEVMRRIYNEQLKNARIERLQNARTAGPQNIPTGSAGFPPFDSASMSALSKERKSTTAVLQKPAESDNAVWGEFLKQPNTGLVNLLSGANCFSEIRDEKLRKSAGDCGDKVLPGKGAHFSFRKREYVRAGWADLALQQGWLYSVGFATQTIIADLGNVPISSLELNDERLRFLSEFVPANTMEAAEEQRKQLETGLESNDLVFYNAVRAELDHTYVLRSIAYDGKLVTVLKFGDQSLNFDSLNGDKRGDSIVVFRVIGKDEFGNVRLVWHLLNSKSSPKLDLPKQELDASQVRRVRVN